MEEIICEDNYKHLDPINLYSPGSVSNIQETDAFVGCECLEECNPETCSCLERSGAKYQSEDISQLSSYSIRENDPRKPFYECNHNCKCKRICGNKLVQFGPRKHLVIINTDSRQDASVSKQHTKGKGYGLVSSIPIKKGNFICEYAGEVLSRMEAKSRYQKYKSMPRTYIFCANEYFGDNHIQTFIDPTHIGNIGRYINHSCEPNCNIMLVRISSVTPKICIFAKNDIPADEELSFDYSGGALKPRDNSENRLNSRNENASGESTTTESLVNRKLCLCGKETCRKFLPFDHCLI